MRKHGSEHAPLLNPPVFHSPVTEPYASCPLNVQAALWGFKGGAGAGTRAGRCVGWQPTHRFPFLDAVFASTPTMRNVFAPFWRRRNLLFAFGVHIPRPFILPCVGHNIFVFAPPPWVLLTMPNKGLCHGTKTRTGVNQFPDIGFFCQTPRALFSKGVRK